MPDPQTPNLGLFIPLNGSDVGTWDVPMNANFTLLDSILGGTANIALSNVPVTLSPAQYNLSLINFTGTLTADVTVTFPALGRVWVVQNSCVGNVSFIVKCVSAGGAGTFVALPPNESMMIVSDATSIKYMGLERIGTYWDFGGSAVPRWVTNTSPQPYLNCDGTVFSSAAYPALRDYLGVATLPDARGRYRAALNQGTARLTGASGTNGVNANTLLATGGNQTVAAGNMPSHSHSLPAGLGVNPLIVDAGGTFNVWLVGPDTGATASAGSGDAYAPPSYVGGLTLIRSG